MSWIKKPYLLYRWLAVIIETGPPGPVRREWPPVADEIGQNIL